MWGGGQASAVRWLTREAGVRQFLDVGSGIPTEPNLHRVAQQVAADRRGVYGDNDPIVLRSSEALLAGGLAEACGGLAAGGTQEVEIFPVERAAEFRRRKQDETDRAVAVDKRNPDPQGSLVSQPEGQRKRLFIGRHPSFAVSVQFEHTAVPKQRPELV